ncbi:metal-binding protein [Dyadobacter chenwenxiniae]|uniref:Metal-binding protein n=1 Tax=Dyadobacter chenwenxiniae TaxID=2906456 RepID=A0A9X1TEF4_9BACT|nr:Ada metal-binding domain-containing protein [Dyadobacter chenwenxiniae]MCF0063041.1 metal-binding protein [Dyadobacter chenwenxiniae]UON84786.1 metal-binding protein [Dyadobacter chenwenxiniae]
MFKHSDLGPPSFQTSRKLKKLIDKNMICYGGNATLKIYGTLQCASGKRMKMKNRVFFSSVAEALAQGFRPCGHCLREAYLKWKTGQNIIPKP